MTYESDQLLPFVVSEGVTEQHEVKVSVHESRHRFCWVSSRNNLETSGSENCVPSAEQEPIASSGKNQGRVHDDEDSLARSRPPYGSWHKLTCGGRWQPNQGT
jgi:hypothetical protein